MGQITWYFTPTSHLAFDSGYGWGPRIQFGGHDRPDNNHALIRVQEQGGIIPGLVYRNDPALHHRNRWVRSPGISLLQVISRSTPVMDGARESSSAATTVPTTITL